ncbi:hypothetical protein ACFO3O_12770 [Dokdonia ponticola]|uniref:Uncharacterized protein n=1 Tax=Dokdonia ponticola TaxID=2041041 RepID=A0ABV9HX93_9FLAO
MIKNTRLTLYYKFLFLFILCLQLYSCQRDDGVRLDTQISEKHQATTQTVKANQIPHIIDFIETQSDKNLSFALKTYSDEQNRSTENLVIGSLNTDRIQQITNSEDKSNYTFTMEKEVPTEEVSVINYIVKENGDSYYSYFLEFIPETSWLQNTTDINNLSQYTGEIKVYDRNGLYIGSNIFVNGLSVSQTSRTACEPVGDDPQDQESDTGGNGGADGTPPTGDDPPGGNDDPTDTGNGGQDIDCVIITITPCSCSGGPGEVITVSACDGQKNNAVRNPCDDECNAQNDCEFGFDANCNCLENPDNPDNENEIIIFDLEFISDCRLLENLANSASFQVRMEELIANNSGNTEIVFFGETSDDDNTNYPDEDRFESNPNELGIELTPPNSGTDSYIHNHFNLTNPNGNVFRALPVFSGSDLYTIFNLNNNGLINDLNSFVAVVTTPGLTNDPNDDTIYALTISNSNDFIDVSGSLGITPVIIDQDIALKGINRNISSNLNELRLAELFKERNYGMTLFRGNVNDLTDWTRIKIKNNGDRVEKNCN